MATWADIQSWDHNAIIEAEDLIEDEVREARDHRRPRARRERHPISGRGA